jgi:hypothetical protein
VDTVIESKDALISLLKNEIVQVKFNKVDGTERVMICTLREDHVKPYEKVAEGREKKVNENIISVWDTENDGWRSFRFDSIISFYKY